ncbi:MAG: spore maturation protein [Clostridia bacterium]|nr:spore maturation protein [Clostridia bacterium]
MPDIYLISRICVFAVPIILGCIIAAGLFRKVPVYESFISGAEDGIRTVIKIFPILLAVLTAVAMLRASGAMELIIYFIKPVTDFLGIPGDIVPLALLRPISGGGSIGLLTDILNTSGADTFTGRAASVIMGSTETTFYTLAVYFRATKVKYTRVALPAALIGDMAGICMSVWICRIIFG